MYNYITFFQRDGMLYDRFDEVHHQKTYPVKMYQTLLEQTGFREIKVYQDFDSYHRKPEHEAERIFVVAQNYKGLMIATIFCLSTIGGVLFLVEIPFITINIFLMGMCMEFD